MDANRLTISKFQRVTEVMKSDKDLLDKQTAIACLITGMPEEHVLKLPLNEVEDLMADVNGLMNQTGSKRIHKYIWVNGTLYKGLTDITELSQGQYVDLKTFGKRDFNTNLHNMLAIIYRPVFKKYNHSKVANDMLDARVGQVFGLLFFYSAVYEKLNPTIQMSLVWATQEIQKLMEEINSDNSFKDGIGSM